MANGQSTVEQSLMQPFAVLATAFNPAGDGGMVMAEDAAGGGDVNAFRHGGHDHGDPRSDGVFSQYKGVPNRLVLQPPQA